MKLGLAAKTEAQWRGFSRLYRKEMAASGPRHDLELLAALSHRTHFSVGCYCEREDRRHRSLLAALLCELGADVAPLSPHNHEHRTKPRRLV